MGYAVVTKGSVCFWTKVTIPVEMGKVQEIKVAM